MRRFRADALLGWRLRPGATAVPARVSGFGVVPMGAAAYHMVDDERI